MANQREQRKAKKRARREKRIAKRVAYRRASQTLPFELLGLPKVSDELIEIAAPLLDDLPPDARAAEWRPVLLLAASIWNMTLAADDRRAEAGDDAADALRADLLDRLERALEWPRQKCESLVSEIEERKRTLFPDDDRFIMDLQTLDTEDGVHVRVASRF